MGTVRWGIVGTGRMAAVLAADIAGQTANGIELTAVASRNQATGHSFASRHGIRHAFDSVSALAAHDEVDAVYIASPHSEHAPQMLACIEAGKAVLCEKPFTLSAAQARHVVSVARARNVFVMEAMWTRFLPAVMALRELLAAGTIGRVQMIVGGGAFVPEFGPEHYLFDRRLGGGALLDAGVYLVSMASMILGTPSGVLAGGGIGRHGVDDQDAIVLAHPDGSHALLYISLRTRRAPDLEILGERGRVRVGVPVFRPTTLNVWTQDGGESLREFPIEGSGYGYQVRAASAAVRAKQMESPIMPLDESVSIMATLDAVRRQVGLSYPGE